MELKFDKGHLFMIVIAIVVVVFIKILAYEIDSKTERQEKIFEWIKKEYAVDDLYWDNEENEFYAREIKTYKLTRKK